MDTHQRPLITNAMLMEKPLKITKKKKVTHLLKTRLPWLVIQLQNI